MPAKLAVGTVDLRTAEEELEFQECEAIVRGACTHFAKVGGALIRIRDKKLYKNEFANFETYCRDRWGFRHSQVWRFVLASQICQTLAALPGIPLPECEAQVRPLAGLPPDQIQEAWLLALGSSRTGHVPARIVARAARQVSRREQPSLVAEANAAKQQRSSQRKAARSAMAELLTLLLGNTERPALLAKAEELQRLLEPFLNPKKTRR